jgi:hypothetical protein
MRSITKAWPAVLTAAALAVALPACGDEETERRLDDAAGDVKREAKQAGRDVEDATREGEKLGSDAKREADKAVD